MKNKHSIINHPYELQSDTYEHLKTDLDFADFPMIRSSSFEVPYVAALLFLFLFLLGAVSFTFDKQTLFQQYGTV